MAGRLDAYFVSGRTKGGFAKRSRVTTELFVKHLRGKLEIGTYPVRDDATCKWSCIDIDNGNDEEAFEQALDLQRAWSLFDVTAWVERSRSKGYHVWLFHDGWISARTARYAGLWVNHISEVNSPEVNPKNVAPWLVTGGLVNTVRTPYSGQANPGRMVMVDTEGKAIELTDFIEAASAQKVGAETLQGVSERWKRHLSATSREGNVTSGRRSIDAEFQGMGVRIRSESQAAAQILRGKRLIVQGERDNQFHTIANYLRNTEVSYQEALRAIEGVWREQLTDKAGFPLSDAIAKVNRAYGYRRG